MRLPCAVVKTEYEELDSNFREDGKKKLKGNFSHLGFYCFKIDAVLISHLRLSQIVHRCMECSGLKFSVQILHLTHTRH